MINSIGPHTVAHTMDSLERGSMRECSRRRDAGLGTTIASIGVVARGKIEAF